MTKYLLFPLETPDFSKLMLFFNETIEVVINSDVINEHKCILALPETKEQFHYLCKYLVQENCNLILVEKSYIDRDYLEDYTEYHLSSFPHYKKTCSRVHFFSLKQFKEHDLTRFETDFILVKDSPLIKDMRENYIGFLVVKPLPCIFVGRTCLRPPASTGI
nr:hypothetical protein [Candidatus Sigynarchaeota archaeon]